MQSTLSTRRSRIARPISWLVVAGLAGAALIGPGAGGVSAAVDWATVTGYAAGTSDNNHEDTWGKDCTKIADGDVGDTYVLGQSYALVIVKAGSEQSAPGHVNTLFANASAGQTVWADSNGSESFDEGDKGISHIIVCGPVETTSTTSEQTTSSSNETSSTNDETTSTNDETTSTNDETTSTNDETTSTNDETTSTNDETTSTSAETTSTSAETSSTSDETTTTSEETTSSVESTTSNQETTTSTAETTSSVESTTATQETTSSSSDGEVLGVEGTPRVTLPPTSTLDAATTTTGSPDALRIVLLGLAVLLASILLLQPKGATSRK